VQAVAGYPLKPSHIVSIFSTFSPGGPQLRIARLMRYLGAEFRHTIVAMDGCFDAAYALDPSLQVDLSAAPPKTWAITYPLALRRMLEDLRPNLLITYNWGAIDAIIAAKLGFLCPIIHNEHGFGPDEVERLKFRRVLARRILLRTIWKTIVPSQNLLRIAVEQYRLPPGKVQFIASGVDVDAFYPSPATEAPPPQGPVFGFVGQLRPEKNLGLLLRAFAASRLSTASLILVGAGPLRDSLVALTSELGIANRVTFAGNTKDVGAWHRKFDVFVLSSLTEQTPMSLLEAMASGLPAICTDVGDCSAILGHPGAPEIVPSYDVEQLADALHAMKDPTLRERLARKNRRRAVELFNATRMFREYEAVYRAALVGRRNR
jgi:glycosyltransferase involved in cell wall biosynthesis